MTNQEKNSKKSLYTTIGIHILLFALFFITLAWTEPDPPIPEYGIEFSMSDNIVQKSESTEPLVAEEISEVEEVSEQEDTIEPTNTPASNPSDDPVVEEPEESQEQEVVESVTEDINSPDVVEEFVEEVTPVEEIQTVEEKGTGEDVEAIAEEEQNEIVEEKSEQVIEPQIDDRAIYKKTVNSEAGGSKGASLDMSGWVWDFKPKPNDTSEENGMIVFQITVDEEGEILNVMTLEKTISPVLEKIYREAVMELTLSPTADNRSLASQSTGTITFIIQSK